MLIDARGLPIGSGIRGQVCIIGGGISGITLALSLADRGHDVVIVEAGGVRSDERGKAAAAGDVSGSEHEPIEDVSARRLGGALALWGGRLLPLDREDIEAPENSWLVGFDELLPDYQQANENLGGGRFQYRAKQALPGARPLLMGTDASIEEEKLWRWGPPIRFKHFKKQLESAANVRLFHHCVVQELRLDELGEKVKSARATTVAAQKLEIHADAFVLCAGGLEVARLLLASRTRRHEGLGNQGGQVGRNYATHPVAEVGLLKAEPQLARRLCRFETSTDGVYCRRFLSFSPNLRRELDLPNINVTFWNPDPHDPAHGDGVLSAYALTKQFLVRRGLTDKVAGAHRSNLGREPRTWEHLQNIVRSAPQTGFALGRFAWQRFLRARKVPALLRAGRAGLVRLRLDAEQRFSSQNQVTLSGVKDEFGLPRLKVSYQVSRQERTDYYRALQVLRRRVAQTAVGELWLPSEEEFCSMQLGDGTHQMGLTRMATSVRDGVVDEHCRVHGVNNLYVGSTSIFPSAGAAPPTLTLVALVLRLARSLSRRLSGSVDIRAQLEGVA